MYVYFEPMGGFNDILCTTERMLLYCEKYNRILLLNGLKSVYKINFSDYFNLPSQRVIIDTKKIINICSNPKYTIYPNELQNEIVDLINNGVILKLYKVKRMGERSDFIYKNTYFRLPDKEIPEDIIIFSMDGGGLGFPLFNKIIFHTSIYDVCNYRYNQLKKPYLAIQIRNTDYKCDYNDLFIKNEDLIMSYKEIYVSTDDSKSIKFFRDKCLNVKNFTTFPKDAEYHNLHESNVSGNTKFIDIICDLYIIVMGDKLLSNSNGCFIELAKDLIKNKNNCLFLKNKNKENYKCKRATCSYLKHSNITNNDGNYCCKMCKIVGKHGELCEKIIFNNI